ncbi:MAG: heparan-alpha-glucosaminide N-acetyltransferase domain-containing protein [Syntrophothermus sp.]
MIKENSTSRIDFIDLMRALAVLMMVQGHTIDTFLSDNFRSFDSSLFSAWWTVRGLTAPIFLFTAGTVFTCLLRRRNLPFRENPRIGKGIKRFILLITTAYLMRFPSSRLFDFEGVTAEQWKTFFAVDVLHLIAFGILFVMGLAYIAEKFRVKDSYIFGSAALISYALFQPFSQINWGAFLPLPLAGYFYNGTGSFFPLVPWTGYVFSGAFLGSYLAHNTDVFNSEKFSLKLLYAALAAFAAAVAGNFVELALTGKSNFWTTSPNLIFFRIGVVLSLNSLVSFITLKIKKIPPVLIHIGRHSLMIYVVHVILLYGSAWTPGLWNTFARSFNIWTSILAAAAMIVLMTAMVHLYELLKSRIKKIKEFNAPVSREIQNEKI